MGTQGGVALSRPGQAHASYAPHPTCALYAEIQMLAKATSSANPGAAEQAAGDADGRGSKGHGHSKQVPSMCGACGLGGAGGQGGT